MFGTKYRNLRDQKGFLQIEVPHFYNILFIYYFRVLF